MIAIPRTDPDLTAVKQAHPEWFSTVGFMAEANWDVEAVTVPRPTAAECEAARSATR